MSKNQFSIEIFIYQTKYFSKIFKTCLCYKIFSSKSKNWKIENFRLTILFSWIFPQGFLISFIFTEHFKKSSKHPQFLVKLAYEFKASLGNYQNYLKNLILLNFQITFLKNSLASEKFGKPFKTFWKIGNLAKNWNFSFENFPFLLNFCEKLFTSRLHPWRGAVKRGGVKLLSPSGERSC